MNTRRSRSVVLAVVALLYLVVMWLSGARPGREQFVAFEAAGVMRAAPADVRRVEIRRATSSWRVDRSGDAWTLDAQPLPDAAAGHLALATKFLHTARPVRELAGVDAHDDAFGLERPTLEVTVTQADGSTLVLAFGGPTPDRGLQYMRLERQQGGTSSVYLMSAFVGAEWRAVADSLP
jgi:hypothetical protein